jgi:hypothetical protein
MAAPAASGALRSLVAVICFTALDEEYTSDGNHEPHKLQLEVCCNRVVEPTLMGID